MDWKAEAEERNKKRKIKREEEGRSLARRINLFKRGIQYTKRRMEKRKEKGRNLFKIIYILTFLPRPQSIWVRSKFPTVKSSSSP